MSKREIIEAARLQDDFLTGLQTWVDLVPEERGSRVEAMQRIADAKLNSRTSLSLIQLQLSSLPEEIWDLTALTELSLYGNQLNAIPAGIGRLVALEILSFGANLITALPTEIEHLTSLKTLHLYDNQLNAIPAEIGRLVALTHLYLGKNRLETLPAEICNLPALTRLDLTNDNQLIPSPALLDRLSELETRGCDVQYPDHLSIGARVDLAKLRLAQIATKYREDNVIEAANPIPNTTELLQRFLDKNAEDRGGVGKLLQATAPTLKILEENPNHLKWAEEIATAYLTGCVNQPVAGWSEISALSSIAEAPTMLEKLELAKHLLVNDRVKEFVSARFVGREFEVEAGNALLREVHKKLLSEGVITKPWLAVPDEVVHEAAISGWLTPGKVQELRDQIEPLLQKTPEELAEFLLNTRRQTWGEINFPEQLKAINNPYEQDRAKRLEEFEDEIAKIPKGPDRAALTEALTTKLAEDQKALAERNQDLVLEEIATLTRSMLAREMQERGMRSLAAGAGAAASLPEDQLAANPPPTTAEISVAAQLQESGPRTREV